MTRGCEHVCPFPYFSEPFLIQCSCGKAYWPSQKWIHEKCVVVNAVVVNEATNVVVNARTKDRHRKTPERAEYVRLKMREHRARRAGPAS